MNKFFCCLLVSLFMTVGATAHTVVGASHGTIKANDMELRVRLRVAKDEKRTLKAVSDSIDHCVRGLLIRSFPLEFTGTTVLQETKKKTPKPSDIDGAWIGGPSKLRFVLHILTYED